VRQRKVGHTGGRERHPPAPERRVGGEHGGRQLPLRP
jgi:hypothetical protein